MSNYSITSKPLSYNTMNAGYKAHRAYITRNQNAKAPVQGNAIMQGAKCPHGFPGGGCPICMGKTGGGGGGNNDAKKREGMSWSEAYYVYMMIQKGKLNAKQDQMLTQMAEKRLALLNKALESKLYQQLIVLKNRAVELVSTLQKTIAQISHTIARTVVKPIIETVNKTVNFIKQTVTSLIGVVNKLTAMVGEKFKIMQEAIKENIKKIMAKLSEIEMLNRLITVLNDKKHQFQDLLFRKVEALKEKILKITQKVTFILQKDDENKGKNKKQGKNKNKKSEE